jgi:hypothetical protein
MIRHFALVLFCCLVASGCRGSLSEDTSLPDVGGSSGVVTWSKHGGANPGIDQASVFHVGTMFVLWSDLPDGGGGDVSTNMHGVSCRGRLLGPDGNVLQYQCESKDGKTGTATINGQQYDLARGSLFLVATGGTTFRIKQLSRDWKNVQFNQESLSQLALRDEEIKLFFAGESL